MRCVFLLMALALHSQAINAAQLSEDRADILYHGYDGGGVTVEGPSVLVRKGFGEKVSLSANYYVDYVTSASIDVLTSGSQYTEEREEYGVGADFLHEKSTLSFHYTNSTESDYVSDTYSFGLSQDFFGDLTTLTLNYSQGDDWVGENVRDPDGNITDTIYRGDTERRRYSLGLTQILTKNWIVAFNVESVVDEGGYLNNPYRSYRYYGFDSDTQTFFSAWEKEVYPNTRNSDAAALRSMIYLPYRASIRFEARAFSDSWEIEAQNFELRYIHPINDRLLLEIKARTYTQTQAFFYSDIFTEEDSGSSGRDEYRARDKELSEFDSQNYGFGLTYEFKNFIPHTKGQSLSIFYDYMQFDYANYRNACLSQGGENSPCEIQYAVGEEPLYSLQANVIRAFFTVRY